MVGVVRLTDLSFSLSWTRPIDASDLAQYNVTVTESVSAARWTAVVGKDSQSQCYRGLESSKVYHVALTAVYIDGSYVRIEERDIPSGGGGGSDDGCPELIPITGVC